MIGSTLYARPGLSFLSSLAGGKVTLSAYSVITDAHVHALLLRAFSLHAIHAIQRMDDSKTDDKRTRLAMSFGGLLGGV